MNPGVITRIVIGYWDNNLKQNKNFTAFNIVPHGEGLVEGIFDGEILTDEQLMYATDYASVVDLKSKQLHTLTVTMESGRKMVTNLAVRTTSQAWASIKHVFHFCDKQTALLIAQRKQERVNRMVPRRAHRYFPMAVTSEPVVEKVYHATLITSSDELDEDIT